MGLARAARQERHPTDSRATGQSQDVGRPEPLIMTGLALSLTLFEAVTYASLRCGEMYF
jgi:hypothetical protein